MNKCSPKAKREPWATTSTLRPAAAMRVPKPAMMFLNYLVTALHTRSGRTMWVTAGNMAGLGALLAIATWPNLKSLNGVMIETTIQGQDKKDFIDLPEQLTIATPLFVRTAKQQIEIDQLAVAGETDVFMRAVSADVESAKVAAFEEMMTECSKIEGAVVGTGHPETTPWDYIK